MRQINEHLYEADSGCFIVRKEDNFIMGEAIDLGSSDSIDNYKDVPFTEDSYKEFYESIGVETPQTEETFRSEEEQNMKKILEFIKNVKDWVAVDGLLHIETSGIICLLLLRLGVNIPYSISLSIIIGILKEVYDIFIKKSNTYSQSLHDIICDIIGIAFSSIVYILTIYLQNHILLTVLTKSILYCTQTTIPVIYFNKWVDIPWEDFI